MIQQNSCCTDDDSVSEFRVLRALVEMQKKDLAPTSDRAVTDYINNKRLEEGYRPARVGMKINRLIERGYVCERNRYQPTAEGLAYFHAKMQSTHKAEQRFQYWCDDVKIDAAVPALA